ncbi:histidine decarboxylase-like [Bacillus rossius redtenbacheri]|uniref:histidine decarboxylase-like n=1 Tax=Bacillus rossius redtenbacheri TaxID=93214 RepID=UPI002FDE0CB8
MDIDEFRKRGKEMVDYIADYWENIRQRRVYPDVKPGYLRKCIPEEAPEKAEPWEKIMEDFEQHIMKGVAHTQSPHMHGYAVMSSGASVLGDMLANSMNCMSFAWETSPACTELEVVVTNWLGKMVGLPSEFLNTAEESKGGGVLQNTTSEATLLTLLSSRRQALSRLTVTLGNVDEARLSSFLVAYCSDQAHSSVTKACRISSVRLHTVQSDEQFCLRGSKLATAIQMDREAGLIPFYLCATLGTTFSCSFDNLEELGPICMKENIWIHVDAAYAGSTFVCPEYRHWMAGIQYVDSFVFLPCKLLLVNFYSCAMWVKDTSVIEKTLATKQAYTGEKKSGYQIDYMNQQISLSREFHSLKLWFVMRSYGAEGLQEHIRKVARLGSQFEALVRSDARFEVLASCGLGVVVFRLEGDNSLTESFLLELNSAGRTFCGKAVLRGLSAVRFMIATRCTTYNDLLYDWDQMQCTATQLLYKHKKYSQLPK